KTHAPAILRVYVRDNAALAREQALSKLLTPDVPVPQFLYAGERDGYPFALVECADGITLRDVLLAKEEDPLCAVHDADPYLPKLQRHAFPRAGTFDEKLGVIPGDPPDYLAYAAKSLADPFTIAQFGPAKAGRLMRLLEQNRRYLPDETKPCLV